MARITVSVDDDNGGFIYSRVMEVDTVSVKNIFGLSMCDEMVQILGNSPDASVEIEFELREELGKAA